LSVTPTYPGVYVEELPSASHAVTAAPTSVAVFIGYTNPFWSPNGVAPPFGTAYEVQSWSDYATAFGGFFNSPWLPDYVGQAVYQFFLNGGSDAYVVALNALGGDYLEASGTASAVAVAPATAPLLNSSSDGFTFTAIQPVGVQAAPPAVPEGVLMTISLSNITQSAGPNPAPVAGDTADVTIVYGTSVEMYRRLLISDLVATVNSQSTLVTVAVTGAAPTTYTGLAGPSASTVSPPSGSSAAPVTTFSYASAPEAGWTTINALNFPAVFAANGSLDKLPVFNLMAIPGITDSATLAAALSFCESKRAFFIMDPPGSAVADSAAVNLPSAPSGAQPIATIWDSGVLPVSPNGALYFPYLLNTDPITGATIEVPPSGYVAGIFANEDVSRGVWKSPAGLETTILGTTGVAPDGVITDAQQGTLNQLGVNCLRSFPGVGTVVFGARTLVSANPAYQQWKYVAVRRMALFVEQSLQSSLLWAVFEPNSTPLWNALTQEVAAFMLGLYRQGAFAGTTANEAFQVQCDSTTTSAQDITNGIVNILVAFAPLSPAEFVVIQISQLAGQTSS
jgi:phage tail sheath protein FI